MRPHLNLRARGAMMALGALCLAISLSVLPGTAQSSDTNGAHAAIAADIAPGKSRLNVLAGRRAAVNGHLVSGSAGRPALLQRQSGHGWTTIDRAITAPAGRSASPFARSGPAARSCACSSTPRSRQIGRLNVYRRAAVSWYGPGLYGNKLSCGGRLTPGTLGVAHKTLPCGSRVTLRKGDRVIRVRVVDRGPYVGGREFDLTSATRSRLHFGGVGSLLVAS